MSIETKHSPLPWEAEAPSLVVLDAYGNVVADCEVETFECERMANAELIALACNNHDKPVGALRRLADVSAVLCNLRAYPLQYARMFGERLRRRLPWRKWHSKRRSESALAAPSLA